MNMRKLGALFWVSSLQYFVIQLVATTLYVGRFSWGHNTISDLGNTVCGMYANRYVCSPAHMLMNASFIVLGLTQMLGALLLCKPAQKNVRNYLGFTCMVLAGLGTIVVGLFPENTVGQLHALGAALPFMFGNSAMFLLARHNRLPKGLAYYSYVSGLVGLSALVLFMTTIYVGIGQGGMERLVAYPQTAWMVVIGVYYLLKHDG